jgi:imidazolonepropionase-like amidohydrolase
MCTACEWAPRFAAYGAKTTRRTALRTGAALLAATAAGTYVIQPGRAAAAPAGPADFVFHNGSVYTVAGPALWAQAVAVTGKTISYVGDDAGALALAGPATRVVDLNGRLLMPGFVEGHTHPFLGAYMSTGVDLQVPTKEDALAAIAQ